MTQRLLKWVAVLAPLAFLGTIDLVRHVLFPELLHVWPGQLLVLGLLFLAAYAFSEAVFGVTTRMQARLAQQNRELLALHQAGLAVAGDLALESVLQKVVDQARELVGARYGALSLLGEDGSIAVFLTSGINAAQREAIGAPPVGRGLLGVALAEGEALRLADLGRDPRSAGFPPNHPPLHSLVAVPICSHRRTLGNLYLADKARDAAFSAADEGTLMRFATQAALAIENARLHEQVRGLAITEERERIAREMHDSLAQVLGYVNTKAQAAQELLRAGQVDRADAQVTQLAEAVRGAYVDVREGILGLRTSLGPEQGLPDILRSYLERWQDLSGVNVDLMLDPSTECLPPLPPAVEVQLVRIVQEALANVRKHAHAARVQVRLAYLAGSVEALVADDGVGFVPLPNGGRGQHFGLITMAERAAGIGGTLTIEAAPGAGTRVALRVPITPAGSDRNGALDASAHR